MTDLLIEGDPVELEGIRLEIAQAMGAQADIEAINATATGELREPLLIGLIVALGGPVVTRAIVTILKNHEQHVEEMKRLENANDAARLDHERQLQELELRGESRRAKWALELSLIEDGNKRSVDIEALASASAT